MWEKIRDLNEQRGQVLANMKAINQKAIDEKRDVTPGEADGFDALRVRADALTKQIDQLEETRRLEQTVTRQGGPRPGRDAIGTPATDDGLQVRALRSDEKTADYLRSRGVANEYGGLTFGRYIRSMILGPKNEMERRALAEGTDSAGGFTVPSVLFAGVVDRLRPAAVVMAAGAQVVPLTSDRNTFAKVLTDPAATWRAENASVAVADATFGSVPFVPKTLAVVVKASRELLEDSLNVEAALETIFAASFASELDRVALVGSGSGSEPAGVASMAGVSSVSMGTNGAALASYSPILDAVQAVETANAKVSALVGHPRTMRAINGLADSTGQPLRRPESLASLPFLSTTGVPITDTQGTASNASKLFVGDWSRLWIGVRTDLRVEVLRETYAGNLQYGFLAYLRADIQASHENAFAKVVGVIP